MTNIVNGFVTYGKWGGPGWSAGEEIFPGADLSPAQLAVPPDDGLDAIFKQHDIDYGVAAHISDPYAQAKAILEADVRLVAGMYGLDPASLDIVGQQYRDAALDLFTTKIMGDFFFKINVTDTITNFQNLFHTAEAIPSPIILDLNGDGVQTTAVGSGAYFDHAADGFAEQTGWVSPDDGLLVRDLNGNGTIDTGRELFGSETLLANGTKASNGFAALAELDTNSDGKIDSTDTAYSTLKIWKDTNNDGYTSAGELYNLADVGVQSINTGYTASTLIDTNSNEHRQAGTFTTTTGATQAAEDIWFQTDQTYSIATEWLDVPADIQAMPDLAGYGKVYDLHQAMTRDTTGQLKTLVTQFTQAAATSERESLLQSILYRWTGVQDIDPASRAASMIYGNAIGDARKLEALEQFMGEEWYGIWCWGTRDPNPHGNAAPVLLQAWNGLYEAYYGQLMAQTHLKPLYDAITYTWDSASQSLRGDLSQAAVTLTADITANRTAGLAELAEFARTLRGMDALTMMDTTSFQEALAPLGTDKPSRKRNKSEAEMKNTSRQAANDFKWRKVA